MLPIQQIFIRPNTPRFCVYTINNSPDLHAMPYEEMYYFISRLTTPEVANLVKKYIDKKEAFFVDIEAGEVYELSVDYQAVEIEARKGQMKGLRPNAEREIKERSNTNIKKDPVQGIDELALIQKSILSIPGERNENSK